MILLLYKYEKDSKENLIVSFFLGLLFDVFNDSLGLYSLTCVLISYFRNLWVLKVVGEASAIFYIRLNGQKMSFRN